MKRTLSVLILLTLALCASAEDQFFYGAWWATHIDHKDVLTKHAGTFFAAFNDSGEFACARFTSLTNSFTYQGFWYASRGSRYFYTTNTGVRTFRGKADANSLKGVFFNSDERGSVQATRQASPL